MSPTESARRRLVADVGGTNTRVALADGARLRDGTVKRFRNENHPGLEDVLRTYLSEHLSVDEIDGAAVAVAGPVRDGRAELTNLDWTIDEDMLSRVTGADRVAVMNDLQAQGHALGHIDDANQRQLVASNTDARLATAAKLVVGVGTGFNIAPVYETPGGRFVPPAEAGHAGLTVRTDEELRLSRFVASAHGFPEVENVLSGRGLERVYAWRRQENGDPGEKRAADVMDASTSGEDSSAEEAVAVFVRTLGTVCGDLALIHLPFGGIFLVGGVARAMAPHFEAFGFADAFHDKGRFSGFMQNFGVHAIEDDFAALTGLVAYLEN